MKKFFLLVLILTVTIFFNVSTVIAFAEDPDNVDFLEYCGEKDIDYLSSTQYQKLVEGLIDGDTYQDAYNQATGNGAAISLFGLSPEGSASRSVDLGKDDKTTNTNFSKSGVIGAINDALELGKKIYDTTSDIVKTQEYGTDWDVDIPVASQLVGKTKLYYDNGVTELVTLGVSFVRYYDSTPAIDMYRNKMQIYGIRQIVSQGGYAATDFNVDIDAGYIPKQYDSSTILAYGANSNIYVTSAGSDGADRFFKTSGVYSALGFNTPTSEVVYYLYFASLQTQSVTYKKFSKYVADKSLCLNNTSKNYCKFTSFSMREDTASSPIVYTISDMQTNSYGDYVNSLDNKTYQPSITYNNTYNAGDKITNNNYKDYGYDYDIDNKTWTYDTDYYNEWLTNYNNTIINNYYNTYQTIDSSGSVYGDTNNTTILPFADPEEPETQPPTNLPTETYPPATIPPSETYPLATLPTDTYYIPDLNPTDVLLEVDTLPAMHDLPEVMEVGGLILQQSSDFLDNIGLLPIYITLGVLSIAIFIMRGQK